MKQITARFMVFLLLIALLLTGCSSDVVEESIDNSIPLSTTGTTIDQSAGITPAPTTNPAAPIATDPTTEDTTPPASESTTPPASEPTTPPASEPTTPPASEPTTPPASEPTTPPASEPTTPPTTEPPATEPPHTHKFSAATCTEPKTCACGATEGKANGHSWADATCTTPKTCSSCGNTQGSATGHAYASGTCSHCGATDPNYVQPTMVWIPNKGGTKYHSRSNCSGMENPSYVTKSAAESLGFTPCKKCH